VVGAWVVGAWLVVYTRIGLEVMDGNAFVWLCLGLGVGIWVTENCLSLRVIRLVGALISLIVYYFVFAAIGLVVFGEAAEAKRATLAIGLCFVTGVISPASLYETPK